MNERPEITEAMLAAAIAAALPLQVNHRDMRKILNAAVGKIFSGERGAPFPLLVSGTLGLVKARWVGVTERRCYYRVETEDGKTLTVHGNDIQQGRGPR